MTKVKNSFVSDTSEASNEKVSEVEEEAESDSSLSLVGRGFRPSVRREAIRRKLQQSKKKVTHSTLVSELHILISVG